MVGLTGIGGRALALGLGLLALAACASTPAPIHGPQRGGAGPSAAHAPPPFHPDAPPRVLDPSAGLQCVPFARNASGIQIYGDAHHWWARAAGRYPRSSTPAAGAVLAIRGYNTNARGHVAVVTEVLNSRLIRVDHANWLNGGEISVGVPVVDVSPANDWSQIRVWHLPGDHWGGRVYAAQGFIHPIALMAMS